ncbi:MAG: hypothetical protein PHO70_07250 [Candidatus Omnitrophica bacterium]|nr:hypothetical protein [Candidatus Omnitrophota bacterium]
MHRILLSPPVAFIILFLVIVIFTALLSRLAFRVKKVKEGTGKSYACGENNYDNMAQPDYSNVFPFAFFFTLAHVATLIIATVPLATVGTFIMVSLYILGAFIGLSILFRR